MGGDFVFRNFFATFINLIDKIFVLVLGIVSLWALCYVGNQILESEQFNALRLRKKNKKNLISIICLCKNNNPFMPKSFLYSHINNGVSPCDIGEMIVIDMAYLSDDSSIFLARGNIK